MISEKNLSKEFDEEREKQQEFNQSILEKFTSLDKRVKQLENQNTVKTKVILSIF